MIGSTAGFAAAANFPTGFTSSTPAIVYGASAPPSADLTAANSISSYLADKVPTSGGTPTGDSVMIGKSSDHLNINNTWAVLTGTINNDDLSILLADGTYSASDSDTYDYEQTIILGKPELKHFRDSDYEEAAGLSDKTPVIGFQIPSSTWVMNYTLQFTSDPESDVVSGEAEDIETSVIPLLGKEYYVSDFDVSGGSAGFLGKLTLLDSAEVGSVSEGETATVGGHEVGIAFIDNDEVKFTVDGVVVPGNDKLSKGETHKLSDGSFIGVRDISKLEVSGETGSVSFSIGTGKLEITSGSDIKLNDDTITGLKGWVYNGSGTATTIKVDKIEIEWKTDDEAFVSPVVDLTMPGFKAVKFSMNDLKRNEEEKIIVERDSGTNIELSLPIKDGNVNFDILYANATGDLVGIGKASDDRLATSGNTTLKYYEKQSGADYHKYFVASYATTTDSESYLLRAKIAYDSGDNRNETTIDKYSGAVNDWVEVCGGKIAGDDCDIGDVTFTITSVQYTAGGNETALFTASSNVNFSTIYTAGGLKIQLPYPVISGSANTPGAFQINDTDSVGSGEEYTPNSTATAGYGMASYGMHFFDEDKDDNVAAGDAFNITIDDTSDNNLQISQVNGAVSGGVAINNIQNAGLELGETSSYETYIKDDVASRIIHYTKPNEDYVEIYYPTGDSETYAEAYLSEASSSSTGEAGNMVYMDSEKDQWKDKNVILVGGSCVNTATAEALGVTSGTCGSDWVAKTSVGENKYLIQIVADKFSTGKIALIAAGYSADDTKAATDRLVNEPETVATTAGNAYIWTVGVTGTDVCLSGC